MHCTLWDDSSETRGMGQLESTSSEYTRQDGGGQAALRGVFAYVSCGVWIEKFFN